MDPGIQARIAAALEPAENDEVLEIGPGRGALTRHLAGKVRRLRAVELDAHLAEELEREFGAVPGVEVVHGDALEVDVAEWADDPASVKVVGNIPYNITSPLIFWFLDQRPRPALGVFMVQREVADRLLAPAGVKAYGALTVSVRAVARVERLFHVPRGAFRPVPEVDSTVVRVTPYRPPKLDDAEERDLRVLTRAAFSWRRKQLQTILRDAPVYGLSDSEREALERNTGLDLRARPETLDPGTFVALSRALRAMGYPTDDIALGEDAES